MGRLRRCHFPLSLLCVSIERGFCLIVFPCLSHSFSLCPFCAFDGCQAAKTALSLATNYNPAHGGNMWQQCVGRTTKYPMARFSFLVATRAKRKIGLCSFLITSLVLSNGSSRVGSYSFDSPVTGVVGLKLNQTQLDPLRAPTHNLNGMLSSSATIRLERLKIHKILP